MNQNQPTALSDVVNKELDPIYCRDEVILASGKTAELGTVLAKLADGKYAPVDPAGSAPANVAVAVAFEAIDATTADKKIAVVSRGAIVDGNCLRWVSTITPAQKLIAEKELTSLGIVVRYSI